MYAEFNKWKSLFKLILLGLMISFCTLVSGQKSGKLTPIYQDKLQKADENMYLTNYKDAIEQYKEVLSKVKTDSTIICKIARAYQLYNKSQEAEEWYRKVFPPQDNSIDSDYIFQFAKVLTGNKKYEEALYWYKIYNQVNSSDKRAIEAIHSIENISGLYHDSTYYIITALPINSSLTDISPRYYKNGLLFLSDRNDKELRLISTFYTNKDSLGKYTSPVKFENGIKTVYNQGAATFYDNYQKVVFSQNFVPAEADLKKVHRVPFRLFQADCDSIFWYAVKPLPFQNGDYSYSQPCITADGKTLYFSSDMPGGNGGFDIYYSLFQNNTWSNPVNLGMKVNSAGDEFFPYLYNDSILYFSSNGHGGLGEQDVFKINLNNQNSVSNLGVPINSHMDDFGFIIDKDGLSGYFASNRNDDGSADDIYSFKQVKMGVIVKIIDEKTSLPIPFAQIIADSSGVSMGTTDQEGNIELIVPVNNSLKITINRDNYETRDFVIKDEQNAQKTLHLLPVVNNIPTSNPYVSLADSFGKLPLEHDVIYKVQIFASRIPAKIHELKRKYKGNLKVELAFEDNWYKYTIGEYSSYQEARQVQQKCHVSDSFIAAYMRKERVFIVLAKEVTKEIQYKN